MLCNVGIFTAVHIGYNNRKVIYENEVNICEELPEERDLGTLMLSDLKWNKQCTKAVKTANRRCD
jgi:hypothetical protein